MLSNLGVNCHCPKQGQNLNSLLSSAIVAPILPTEPDDHNQPNQSQGSFEWVDCDLEVLWVELKQILHLKVGCSDFGPVRDRGSLPYLLPMTLLTKSYWGGTRAAELTKFQ